MNFDERCQSIELILSDVDGVLTDGGLIFDNQGTESKRFHVRDGMGINLWQQAGCKFGIVTSRNSHIVEVRSAELGIEIVRQGFSEKLPVVHEVAEALGLRMDQVAFIGDDLSDLAAINAAGLGIAVADATAEIRAAANYTTQLKGGEGAVREVVETILKSQKRWDDLVHRYA